MPLPSANLADTNFGRILEAVQTTIRELALPGITSENVVISKVGYLLPTDTFPRIIIEPRTEIAEASSGTNERDDTVYSVMISILFAATLSDGQQHMGLHLYWRQQIWRTLRNKKPDTYPNLTLEAGSSLLWTTLEPGDVYIEQAKRDQLDAQYFLGQFLVREPRTNA